MVLGAYSLISQDDRYDKLHQILSNIFHEAMVDSEGRALNSFPEYSWPFDTVPVVLSLYLYDKKMSSTHSKEIITRHLEWIREKASDPQLELPYSRINNMTGQGIELPRGCDLSFRLCLLSHIDQEYSKHLYEKYTTHFWLDLGIFAGFSEWPNGQMRFEDIDSGPIVMGIGLGATGMGLGAATALEDGSRLNRLTSQMTTVSKYIVPLLAKGQKLIIEGKEIQFQMIPINDEYFSGFLFGDAMLFYCVTWQPWIEYLKD
jgi:hypothetical protein